MKQAKGNNETNTLITNRFFFLKRKAFHSLESEACHKLSLKKWSNDTKN